MPTCTLQRSKLANYSMGSPQSKKVGNIVYRVHEMPMKINQPKEHSLASNPCNFCLGIYLSFHILLENFEQNKTKSMILEREPIYIYRHVICICYMYMLFVYVYAKKRLMHMYFNVGKSKGNCCHRTISINLDILLKGWWIWNV